MIFEIIFAFLLFLIFGRIFLKDHRHYSTMSFIAFILFNLTILIWFIMQYKFGVEALLSYHLDVLERIIPRYILSIIKIVCLHVIYNVTYVILHCANKFR